MNTPSLIEDIRLSSRRMVRELGFMNKTLASTSYSASAVHCLLEISARGQMSAKQLVEVLFLDKSSVSRMLVKLIEAGELQEVSHGEDGRIKMLELTGQGKLSIEQINAYGRNRVSGALAKLTPAQQQAVAQGMAAYADALTSCRENGPAVEPPITIVSGYQPGIIGRIAEMHAGYYSRHYGFGHFFEAKVASGLAEFSGRLDEECNQIWSVVCNGRIAGSVAIDGQDLGKDEAHLRWFILDDSCRGQGAGKKLLTEALAFCDRQGFSAVRLWTFNQLTAARHLYESFGFELAEEWQGDQWGSSLREQEFIRRKGSSSVTG